MKIALVQLSSVNGALEHNIRHHVAAVSAFAPGDVDLLMFPELSLTSYEPEIAQSAAIAPDDPRLDRFQAAADRGAFSIFVGAPTRSAGRPFISLIGFTPGRPRTTVHKSHLHPDELAYFSAPVPDAYVLEGSSKVALAICYEISIDAHIARAAEKGMDIYLASVAKTVSGIEAASARLQVKAKDFRVPVLVANCVGICEGKVAGGSSLAISAHGAVARRLDASEEAALVYDLDTGTTVRVAIPT